MTGRLGALLAGLMGAGLPIAESPAMRAAPLPMRLEPVPQSIRRLGGRWRWLTTGNGPYKAHSVASLMRRERKDWRKSKTSFPAAFVNTRGAVGRRSKNGIAKLTGGRRHLG